MIEFLVTATIGAAAFLGVLALVMLTAIAATAIFIRGCRAILWLQTP